MEEVKDQEKNKMIRTICGTILVVGGAYVLGCMVGSAKTNRVSIESYKKGVYDTLESIILRPEK